MALQWKKQNKTNPISDRSSKRPLHISIYYCFSVYFRIIIVTPFLKNTLDKLIFCFIMLKITKYFDIHIFLYATH